MPQTQTQIAEMLAAAGLRPQKRHGQHFLVDLNLMRVLADAAEIRPTDTVLEIGPGTGSLTELLAERAGRVVAVEIDPKIVEVAKKALAAAGRTNVTWLQFDILRGKNKLNPQVVIPLVQWASGSRLIMVANLPYGAASPVIANCLTDGLPFAGMWVTIQKEVADRLTAPPGGKEYGPLTVTVQALSDVKTFRKVPPSAFWPRPEVDSAMVSVIPNAEKRARIRDLARFDKMIEGIFTQRRKALKSAVRAIRDEGLAAVDWPAAFAAAGVSESDRCDQLPVAKLVDLANEAVARMPAPAGAPSPAPGTP
jgi:16S rRNA (adenine1518-N6/adenine1519-N6)-dimethyltransferase